MRANYSQMQAWIGLSEGGFVDHPDDPGGATDRGITQATFNAWRRSQGEPVESVRGISKAEAEAIIARNYFDKAGCDELPAGLDYAVGDYAVNSGVSKAASELQTVLGFRGRDVDGIVGVKTIAAAQSVDVEVVIDKLCKRRMSFLRRLPHWPTFKGGWTRRVMGDEPGAQDYDVGVIDRAIELHRTGNGSAPKRATPGKATGKPSLLRTIVEIITNLFGGRAHA